MNYEGPYNWFQHLARLNQVYLLYSQASWYISLLAIWKQILSIIWHDIMDAHVYIDHAEVSACECMFNNLFACSPCLYVYLNAPFFPDMLVRSKKVHEALSIYKKLYFICDLFVHWPHMNTLTIKKYMRYAHTYLISIWSPPYSYDYVEYTLYCERYSECIVYQSVPITE